VPGDRRPTAPDDRLTAVAATERTSSGTNPSHGVTLTGNFTTNERLARCADLITLKLFCGEKAMRI
jgi:hypothetical protein